MLYVVFHMGNERFALETGRVREIVSLVRLKEIPRAPDYVRGLFRYRGRVVPVIDLCCLAGLGSSRQFLSTRIVLVDYPDRGGKDRILGLLAEGVTDTIHVNPADLASSGIQVKEAPYLGPVVAGEHGMIQCIRVEDLLPPTVQELLFP